MSAGAHTVPRPSPRRAALAAAYTSSVGQRARQTLNTFLPVRRASPARPERVMDGPRCPRRRRHVCLAAGVAGGGGGGRRAASLPVGVGGGRQGERPG